MATPCPSSTPSDAAAADSLAVDHSSVVGSPVLGSPVLGSPAVDYPALARFRLELRRFLTFSERTAQAAGLEPQQHQLLLALKGLSAPDQPPTVGNVATWLAIQHHSAVELVDRAVARGLVRREHDAHDRRRVLVRLTDDGEALLDRLSLQHRAELQSTAPALLDALRRVLDAQS